MKKILFFMMAMLPLMFIGCSDNDDEEEENKYEASQESVQGSWMTVYYDEFFKIIFTGNKYSFFVMDVETSKITHREHGTFKISNHNLSVETNTNSMIDYSSIYFKDKGKNILYLSIAGEYTRDDVN